jgi:hypothetical protein
MIKIGRARGPGGRRLLVGTIAVAAFGALGGVPAAAQASVFQVPTWTKQVPVGDKPLRLAGAAMTYDAANSTAVLFDSGRTWAWNGSAWIRQERGVRPFGTQTSMAYDAASGDIVMFGGLHRSGELRDTWIWNGSTWVRQAPAPRPPARGEASMAYDAATGNVVLFGGYTKTGSYVATTWTWDGSSWTKQDPATSPPARDAASMAYDAATGTVVLFGGVNSHRVLSDTWTWDGSTWTNQAPAAHPSARQLASMAYDAATGNVVLFGGYNDNGTTSLSRFNDTWTWG